METANDFVRRGQELEATDQYAEALKQFEQARLLDDRRLDALSGLARCAQRLPDSFYEQRVGNAAAVIKDFPPLARGARVKAALEELQAAFQRESQREADTHRGQRINLADDELRLVAAVRLLKSYGASMARVKISRRVFESLRLESVKTDFST